MDDLRPEVLRMPTEDGGLDLFDLLYDRIVHLDAEEARSLAAGDASLRQRLEALVLFEGEHADTLRRELWTRRRAEVAPRVAPPIADVDWDEATDWPALVATPWRDPERLRRLAEGRAAGLPTPGREKDGANPTQGSAFLDLPGFVAPEAARRLAEGTRALPFERMDTEWVRGERRLLAPGELDEWRVFLASGRTRRLLGGLLGRELPERITANAWRLGVGDGMPVHADGRHYHGTVSLGLCEGWTAAHGGAIALGVPRDGGFDVARRWLPHLGDLLIFAPARTTWHAVEPVERGPRWSITAWWTKGAVGAALSPTAGRGDGA